MGVGVMGVTEGVSELEPPPQPESRAIGRTSVAKSLKIFMVVTYRACEPRKIRKNILIIYHNHNGFTNEIIKFIPLSLG